MELGERNADTHLWFSLSSSEITRCDEWDSVITCHANSSAAHTWHYTRRTIGKHTLISSHVREGARPQVGLVTGPCYVTWQRSCEWVLCLHVFISQCVTITACGNFAIIGMSTGHIEMFNMQSGIRRGEFGKPRGQSSVINRQTTVKQQNPLVHWCVLM